MKAIQRPFTFQFLTLPIGVGLLVWLFWRQDWQRIITQFQSVQYVWAVPVLAVTVCNYVWRALRWRLFLPAFGFPVVFRALMMGYLINLALPRVGELVRIWALQKNKPFLWEGLGTVVAERVLDLLCLVVIMLVFLLTNLQFLAFFTLPVWVGKGSFFWIIAGLGSVLVFLVVGWLWRVLHRFAWWQDFQRGLVALWQLRRQGWLWIYTLLIWWSYTAMSYFWFFALPATAHLGWNVAFGMLALGTLSRVVPLQANSAGVYHGLIVMVLGLYGVGESPALALTVLIHSTQLLFNLWVGAICWFWEGREERREER